MSKPFSPTVRLLLAFLWLGLLLLAGALISQRLEVSGDLRKFMPAPQTPAQKLLIDELGEGPGARLLLMGLSGADAATLAAQSQQMRAALADDPRFVVVANGEQGTLTDVPPQLLPYRYLLGTPAEGFLDAEHLREALFERLQDLGSPAAGFVEPLIGSDPTLEVLRLAESWEPANAPQRLHEVWFDQAGEKALLLAETRAAGFDPTGQQQAVDAIQAAFELASAGSDSRLTLTGPGAFSVEIGNRTAREAGLIGSLDTLGLILLLWVAYRSWKMPLLGVLPLASAGLAGLGSVALLFQQVHGITIAFGFTLIGVVQDYPIHLFSQQRQGQSPWQTVRAIWPTLGTGVIATSIAYATFLLSGVDGLQQLAVFTIAALIAAALVTRFLLPALLDQRSHDPATSPRLQHLWAWIERIPRPRYSLALLALASLAVILFAPGQTWENDLSRLTPVPADAMAADTELRTALGAPDVRYVLTVQADDAESALAASERLLPALQAEVDAGRLGAFDMAARYLPSAATQRTRQAALPDAATLRTSLQQALAEVPFRAEVFEPFLADVQRAREAAPLRLQDLQGTLLQSATAGLLLQQPGHATALVSLGGVADPATLAALAQRHGAQLLDLKQASESLVADYRGRILLALAVAALLLVMTVWLALRDRHRAWRVLLPMGLTLLLTLAMLRGFGVELNLFHLVALILGAGLGLDYALFFEHAGDRREDQLRTLHAVIVCSLMTLLVFALLGLSSIPVLRAIGVTVTLGVVGNFILGLLVARHPPQSLPMPQDPASNPGAPA